LVTIYVLYSPKLYHKNAVRKVRGQDAKIKLCYLMA